MTAPSAYKRKILIIKPGVQYRFIALVIASVAVGVGIIALDMFTSLGKYLADAGGDFAGVYADTKFALAVKLTIYLGGLLFLSVIVSNRVAGPVYRFEKSAEQVAQGDLTSQVFLRKGDEFLDLRDGFNAMVDGLRNRAQTEASRAHRVRELLAASVKDAGIPPETLQKLKDALSEAEKMGKSFKV